MVPRLTLFAVSLTLLAATAALPVQAAEDFYKGKQINLIVGSEAGGGYTAYARLLQRYMPKHIPGNPSIVVQNMPGAGGLQAINHLANIAPKDGTVFASFNRNLPLNALVEKSNDQVRFDPLKLTWLGSASSGAGDAYMLIVRDDVPIKRIEEVQGNTGKSLLVATTAPGSQSYDVPSSLIDLLGLNLKIVTGYPSSAAMSLAMMRQESDGRMIGLSALRSTQPEWVEKKMVRILIQTGRIERHPDMLDVPNARDLAPDAGSRALIEFMDATLLLSWPYAAPPGIPADRAAILQKAFMDTVKDPEYIAEADKQKMELSPISGADIQKVLQDLTAKMTPELIERYNRIVARSKQEAK